MKRNLGCMYGQLTPTERFQLIVEAFAREDEREAERLSNTCPRQVYEINDPDFIGRLRASQLIASYVCVGLIEVLSALRMMEAYKEVVETYQEVLFSSLERATEEAALSYHQGWDAGCDHAWQIAEKSGPFPWNDKAHLPKRAKDMAKRIKAENSSEATDGSRLEELEEVSEALSVQVRTIWEAFSRFCRERTGLKPETVLQGYFPTVLELLEELNGALGSAQANSESLQDYEAMMVRTWHELVGD